MPPEKRSPTYLPELLTLWDAKFNEATLKLIARNSKAEREAASVAGLWKEGSDKHDLNAMRAQCTPEQARDFTEALATVVQKKKAPAKPKELASVVAATSDMDPVTGERKDKVSASVSAVATMRSREIVKSMGGAAEQGEQMLALTCTATRFRSKGQTAGSGCGQRASGEKRGGPPWLNPQVRTTGKWASSNLSESIHLFRRRSLVVVGLGLWSIPRKHAWLRAPCP